MNIVAPIVVDLGEVREPQITGLFAETGQLLEDITQVFRVVHAEATGEPGSRIFLPVVAVYHLHETGTKRRKTLARRRRSRNFVRHIDWPER
jgi:hypothetical protein